MNRNTVSLILVAAICFVGAVAFTAGGMATRGQSRISWAFAGAATAFYAFSCAMLMSAALAEAR